MSTRTVYLESGGRRNQQRRQGKGKQERAGGKGKYDLQQGEAEHGYARTEAAAEEVYSPSRSTESAASLRLEVKRILAADTAYEVIFGNGAVTKQSEDATTQEWKRLVRLLHPDRLNRVAAGPALQKLRDSAIEALHCLHDAREELRSETQSISKQIDVPAIPVECEPVSCSSYIYGQRAFLLSWCLHETDQSRPVEEYQVWGPMSFSRSSGKPSDWTWLATLPPLQEHFVFVEEAPVQQDVMWAADSAWINYLPLCLYAVNGKGDSEALEFWLPWGEKLKQQRQQEKQEQKQEQKGSAKHAASQKTLTHQKEERKRDQRRDLEGSPKPEHREVQSEDRDRAVQRVAAQEAADAAFARRLQQEEQATNNENTAPSREVFLAREDDNSNMESEPSFSPTLTQERRARLAEHTARVKAQRETGQAAPRLAPRAHPAPSSSLSPPSPAAPLASPFPTRQSGKAGTGSSAAAGSLHRSEKAEQVASSSSGRLNDGNGKSAWVEEAAAPAFGKDRRVDAQAATYGSDSSNVVQERRPGQRQGRETFNSSKLGKWSNDSSDDDTEQGAASWASPSGNAQPGQEQSDLKTLQSTAWRPSLRPSTSQLEQTFYPNSDSKSRDSAKDREDQYEAASRGAPVAPARWNPAQHAAPKDREWSRWDRHAHDEDEWEDEETASKRQQAPRTSAGASRTTASQGTAEDQWGDWQQSGGENTGGVRQSARQFGRSGAWR